MPDNGTQNYSLPINGSYTIQEGYHSGQGKVTQSITTMKGASVTPNTSVTTIATDQKYINGNFTIPAFALPSPSILKKGAIYTIYGKSVEGQFEGYVPGNADLYYKGQNPGQLSLRGAFNRPISGAVRFETAQLVTVSNSSGVCQMLCPASPYNLTPWNKINIEVVTPSQYRGMSMYYGTTFNADQQGFVSAESNQGVYSFTISHLNDTKYIGFYIIYRTASANIQGVINRIYFS